MPLTMASERLKHEEAWFKFARACIMSGFLSSAVQIGQISSPDYFLQLFWISCAIYDCCLIFNHHNHHHMNTKATSYVCDCQSGDFTFLWLKVYHYWKADRLYRPSLILWCCPKFLFIFGPKLQTYYVWDIDPELKKTIACFLFSCSKFEVGENFGYGFATNWETVQSVKTKLSASADSIKFPGYRPEHLCISGSQTLLREAQFNGFFDIFSAIWR